MTGIVVWMTGRPASGKTTLARRVKDLLDRLGVASCILDSDEIRTALANQDYTPAGRDRAYDALARLAALLADQGIAVLVAATAHRAAYRERARDLAPQFAEVYVAATAEQCAERDEKGLYENAAAGAVTALPGLGVPYEPPGEPDVLSRGGLDADAADAIVDRILELQEAAEQPRNLRWN